MGKQKIVAQLGVDGYLLGPTMASESPLEPGVFLIPGGAVDIPPPDKIESGKVYRLSDNGQGWIEHEDHRDDTLYRTDDGAAYRFSQAYDGIGPIPEWLTAQPRPDAWSVWKDNAWVRDDAAWQTEIRTRNQQEKKQRLNQAGQRIAILQDAADLGLASETDNAALRAWRQYRVAVSRVEVDPESPAWPQEPQPEITHDQP